MVGGKRDVERMGRIGVEFWRWRKRQDRHLTARKDESSRFLQYECVQRSIGWLLTEHELREKIVARLECYARKFGIFEHL